MKFSIKLCMRCMSAIVACYQFTTVGSTAQEVTVEGIPSIQTNISQLNFDLNLTDNQQNADPNYISNDVTFNNDIVIGRYDSSYSVLTTLENGTRLMHRELVEAPEGELPTTIQKPVLQYDPLFYKWYFIDDDGNYKIKDNRIGNRIELNTVKLNIQPNCTLTLQNSLGGGGTYLFNCN